MKIEYNKHRVEYLLSLFKMTAAELLSSINKDLKTPITWEDIDSDEIELNYLKRIDKVFKKGLLYYYDPAVPVKDKKVGRHSGDLIERQLTQVHIQQRQMGLGCVNSWGAWPRREYLLPNKERSFTFVIRPLQSE